MNTGNATTTAAKLGEAAADLARNGSLEWSVRNTGDLEAAADSLPRGTHLYLPSPPGVRARDRLRQLAAIRQAGFEPVPHLAARGQRSKSALREFLEPAVSRNGVRRVLLVAGDHAEALGPWENSLELLESGLLAEAGIREVAVAGYPEGPPHGSPEAPFEWLEKKQAVARDQDLGLEVVTQFCFVPARVTEYCAELARSLPDLPVYAGVAGPADIAVLRKFARRCRVSPSLRALDRLGYRSASEAVHLNASEQLAALAHYCAVRASPNVVGLHLYCFGGLEVAGRWLRQQFTRPLESSGDPPFAPTGGMPDGEA